MAKKTIKLSVRFVFNRKTGKQTKELGRNTARFVANEVAILTADNIWDTVSGKLRTRLIRDGNREIAAVAQQFKRYIVGANGMNRGVTGRLESAAAGAEGLPVSQRLSLTWADRDKSYLARKKREVGHTKWFEHGGGLGGGIENPVNRELQNAIGKTSTWTRAFGPVGVRITRRSTEFGGPKTPRMLDVGGGMAYSEVTDTKRNRLSIATVSVYAFGRITPQMLGALHQGGDTGPSSYIDGRATGLIGLLPTQLQYRLGGNPEYVPYRPTLEPFLEFFLTRSLPNAVTRRLEQGVLSRL